MRSWRRPELELWYPKLCITTQTSNQFGTLTKYKLNLMLIIYIFKFLLIYINMHQNPQKWYKRKAWNGDRIVKKVYQSAKSCWLLARLIFNLSANQSFPFFPFSFPTHPKPTLLVFSFLIWTIFCLAQYNLLTLLAHMPIRGRIEISWR